MARRKPTKLGYVMAQLLVLFGIGIIAQGVLHAKMKAMDMKQWPKIQGSVISDKISVDEREDKSHKKMIYFFREIQYRYEWKGYSYNGSRHSGQYDTTPPKQNEGQAIGVFVNPANPSESVLLMSWPGIWIPYLVCGVAIAVLGLFFFLNTRFPNPRRFHGVD